VATFQLSKLAAPPLQFLIPVLSGAVETGVPSKNEKKKEQRHNVEKRENLCLVSPRLRERGTSRGYLGWAEGGVDF
jgi:hypothetical protein